MAKRKFSFLADENEKYEQEYQKELAEEKKIREAEVKRQLANKGKHGVSMVSGNTTPIVGEKNTYHVARWYEDTPYADRDPEKVTWELFKKRSNGKFTSTNIKKIGDGTFTFGEISIQNTYRLEGYLHKPEGGGLIINPKPSTIPKIGKVELHYVDDKKGDTFSFYDKLRAKAHTTGMRGKYLVFTLWEDDAKGGGHSAGNQPIEVKSARVQHNGLAVVEFTLTKGLMQKAMKGEADVKGLEFYVTVEYYKGKTHDSKNINVHNPFHKVPEKKISHPKAPGSPAEQKPPSKREEKNLLIHHADGYLLHDWAEVKGKAQKDKEVTVNRNLGRSTVGVKSQPIKKQEGKCLCQQYDLVWGDKIGCNERKKVVEVAKNLGIDPNWLMTVMALETNETFSPAIDNGIGYVGLIQFGKDAANDIHTTTNSLKKMSFIQQMDYVQKHLTKNKSKYKTLTDLYLAVLYPSACGHGAERNYIVLDGEAYKKNPFFFKEKGEWEYATKINKKGKLIKYKSPTNPNGKTYVWEIGLAAQEVYTKGLSQKESKFKCDDNKEEKIIKVGDCLDTWDKVTNEKIRKLHPKIRCAAKNFINEVESTMGIQLRIIQGYRSYAEQDELYAQGRTKSGNRITNAKGGQSNHNFGLAIDVAEIKDGKIDWFEQEVILPKVAPIGKKWGFDWGGDWKSFKDKPHFEMMFGKSLSELRKLLEENNNDHTKITL